jgi:hypothetical protein
LLENSIEEIENLLKTRRTPKEETKKTDKENILDMLDLKDIEKYRIEKIKELGKYTGSHILNIRSFKAFIELLIFLIAGKYPESVVPSNNSDKLLKDDSGILKKSLQNLEGGSYTKFMVVSRSIGGIEGHSMLIYKDKEFTVNTLPDKIIKRILRDNYTEFPYINNP